MTERLEVAPTYDRILTVLRAAIRASGRTQIELDRVIGRRQGYLSHVFQGRVQLKVRDLLAVIHALGLDPAAFLGYLILPSGAGVPRPRPAGCDAGSAAAEPEEAPAEAATRGELETLIATLLDRSVGSKSG